jgi:adenine-specific DNA-methyltransferase
MNFIGSKDRLLGPLIDRAILKLDIQPGRFADAFGGTHAVGAHFQRMGWEVTSNDTLAFSEVLGVAKLATEPPAFTGLEYSIIKATMPVQYRLAMVIGYLQQLMDNADGNEEPHWFLDKYCEGGSKGRLYLSRENGRKIVVAREAIEKMSLTRTARSLLLSSLLNATDKVLNCASVQAAYLKALKVSARKPIQLVVPVLSTGLPATVTRVDAVDFACERAVRVLYLDPPYNHRQYAPNYHIFETITEWDDPQDNGKTGLRPYDDQKSAWCQKRRVLGELRRVIENSNAEWIMLSYSDEGLMNVGEILETMAIYGGEVTKFCHQIPRYQSDTKENRAIKDGAVTESLYCARRR